VVVLDQAPCKSLVACRRSTKSIAGRLIALTVMAMGLPSAASAVELAGPARVIDGDTIEIGSRRIRLHGIDAPETAQRCQLPEGTWDCGAVAEAYLARLVEGRTVRCVGTSLDQYDRLIAVCATDAEPQLNAKMVADGLAWAFVRYSDDYIEEEAKASTHGLGIWQAKTQPPWEYRERRWATAVQIAPNGCPIKGNINRQGERIYHTPWSRHYTRTKVNLAAGERWFCSESEALAAGWRPPIR